MPEPHEIPETRGRAPVTQGQVEERIEEGRPQRAGPPLDRVAGRRSLGEGGAEVLVEHRAGVERPVDEPEEAEQERAGEHEGADAHGQPLTDS